MRASVVCCSSFVTWVGEREHSLRFPHKLRWLIRHPNPLILIDWSDLHEDCRWQLLRASIPMSGRAVTVLEMVFTESMKGSPRAEKKFLHRLNALSQTGLEYFRF